MPIIKEGKVGKATVKIGTTAKGYAAVVEDGQRKFYVEGDDPDRLWVQAQDAAARLNPLFVGYDGSRKRFLSFFPDGFRGADYIGHERAYKVDAKEKLEAQVTLDSAATGSGHGEAVLAAYRVTNLLSPFEKTKLQPLLRGPDADRFVQAAAIFTLDTTKSSLAALRAILKPYDSAKWTVISYLPFLWEPSHHFFLKPTMITHFASRVGHRFAGDYSADLELGVYESLLDLAAEVKAKVADLEPRDMIDVQSFMWTSVEYTEADRADFQSKAGS